MNADERRSEQSESGQGEAMKQQKPKEIWLLRDVVGGNWVMAADVPPGGENYLACFSQRDADAACELQMDLYQIDCEPVRVMP